MRNAFFVHKGLHPIKLYFRFAFRENLFKVVSKQISVKRYFLFLFETRYGLINLTTP